MFIATIFSPPEKIYHHKNISPRCCRVYQHMKLYRTDTHVIPLGTTISALIILGAIYFSND
jgi:hypothetical protein